MNVSEFVAKWRKVELTERSASQQHFLDLCHVFNHPTPAQADPTGETFTFEKGAAKHGGGLGWADVWKKGFFGWEYKGKHKDLVAAYDQLLKYRAPSWIVDTGTNLTMQEFSFYEAPYIHVLTHVKPERDKNKRDFRREHWWLHAETALGMRKSIENLRRYIATPRVSKYRIFVWVSIFVLCDDGIYVFARADDYFFGVVHSKLQEVWARAQGTQVRERESGFRYTATTCFEAFPFPIPSTEQEAAIAAAARELDALRSAWLNPPEWTREEVLDFLARLLVPGALS